VIMREPSRRLEAPGSRSHRSGWLRPLRPEAQEGDGCPALIELLAVGAARDARDADGLTASDYARARGEADKLEALA